VVPLRFWMRLPALLPPDTSCLRALSRASGYRCWQRACSPDRGQEAMSRPANPSLVAMYTAALLVVAPEARAGDERRPVLKVLTPPDLPSRFIVRQQFDAHVAKVDQSRNTLTLKTAAGTVEIVAAPAIPAYFRRGDRVVLELGIFRSAHADPPTRRRAAREATDPAIVRQRLNAAVTGVDLRTGILTLKSVAGPVKVVLPSGALSAFRRGDVVPVELAVVPAMPVQGSPATDPNSGRRAALVALLFGLFGRNK
jgi:hypothetical protein